MEPLFDPLVALSGLGAYARLVTGDDGVQRVALTYARTSTFKSQRQAQALAARFERLLILQLDVPAGHNSRTVHQLVAAGEDKGRGRAL